MKRWIPLILCLPPVVLLLVQPGRAGEAVGEALRLCAGTVVPSLFPFLVVTSLLLRLGLDSMLRPLFAPVMQPLFRLRGQCAAPLLAGLLGGYPAGARAASQLYEQGTLGRRETELLLGFCNNCSPGFLIGFVGVGVFGSTRVGVYLALIHALAALLGGIILCRVVRREELPALPDHLPAARLSFGLALTASVSDGVAAILSISAYVVLFRTAAALLPAQLPAVAQGALEMVGGIASLAADRTGFAAAAALTAWGGLSVHCQTMAVTKGLSLRIHTVGKLLQALIAAILAAVAFPWLM